MSKAIVVIKNVMKEHLLDHMECLEEKDRQYAISIVENYERSLRRTMVNALRIAECRYEADLLER